MKHFLILLVALSSFVSFSQACKDSVHYKFMDLSICNEASIDIMGYENQKIFVALVEEEQDKTIRKRVVQIRPGLNFKDERPIDIWAREHSEFINRAKQVTTVLDTTYKLNGNDFYWNESMAQVEDQRYFMIYTGIIFYKNQYYILKIGGQVDDKQLKPHILNVANNCHILPTGHMEEDFKLQHGLVDNILLSVQNEKRLENITIDFETFYKNIPDSEKSEETKKSMQEMLTQWVGQTKIYLRGMRQFDEVNILNFYVQPDKTDEKVTVYGGEIVFELDKKIFKAKIACVKIDHKLYLMAINGGDNIPEKK